MDSVFLASLGYQVTFYELTRHHIAIAQWFANRFSARFGDLPIRFVQAGIDAEPRDLDAVVANEVAHHIEPAAKLFERSAAILRREGHLFLLEPNFMSPLVQVYFFRVRGFRTTEWQKDSETGARYLWGNEHIRPLYAWNRLAHSAGFRFRTATYVLPWLVGGARADYVGNALPLERLPVVRALLASHITIDYLFGRKTQIAVDA